MLLSIVLLVALSFFVSMPATGLCHHFHSYRRLIHDSTQAQTSYHLIDAIYSVRPEGIAHTTSAIPEFGHAEENEEMSGNPNGWWSVHRAWHFELKNHGFLLFAIPMISVGKDLDTHRKPHHPRSVFKAVYRYVASSS